MMKVIKAARLPTKESLSAFSNIFCEYLKEYRYEKRLTQREIAEKLNVAASTYSNWELGRTQPNLDDLHNLILILNIDASELFDI